MEIIKFKVVHILIIVTLASFVTSKDSDGNLFEVFGKSSNTNKLNVHLSKESPSAPKDAFLSTDEIIKKYGYPVETHFVTTEDGYILQLHRIPRPGGKPFLLQHGLLSSSAVFVITRPEIAPAYYLWDKGYDVWLGNNRGNTYSRNHTSLDPNKRPFWDFSFHEMAIYDLPAIIDYILDISDHSKLTYVGHSQGTTIFFVMCIKRPEYNEKVEVMHALAPVAFDDHIYSVVAPLSILFLSTPLSYYIYELLPSIQTYLLLCSNEQEETQSVCSKTMFMKTRRDYKILDVKEISIILGHIPAGTATKVLRHFTQMTISAKFCEFDYGRGGNFEHYGQGNPPDYDISKIKVPIALFNSYFDKLSVPPDVERLDRALGDNVIARIHIAGFWNHNDFLWSKDLREVIYDKILTINSKIESDNNSENKKI